MTKRELDEFVLLQAAWGRDAMLESHGSFPQHAAIMDLKGKLTLIALRGQPLHGKAMRDLLWTVYAMIARGGADALAVISDSRVQSDVTPEQSRTIAEAAQQGKWIIAENPANQEALIVIGRSREHTSFVCMPYAREHAEGGDVIHFDDPEPHIDDRWTGITTSMIPNIWDRVN